MYKGSYADYFRISHNAVEFVLDFSRFYTENEEAEIYIYY